MHDANATWYPYSFLKLFRPLALINKGLVALNFDYLHLFAVAAMLRLQPGTRRISGTYMQGADASNPLLQGVT
ncbi:MAG: hypothetical protein KBT18_00905 [Comamonas sp.]|nr:hypothetical protein [Candidatus Comamonas equi]